MALKMTKEVWGISLLALLLCALLISPGKASAQELTEESTKPLTKQELLEHQVDPQKVDALVEKMEEGEKLDSDIYLEQVEESVLATSEDKQFRKDFPDGSFVESEIEDITNEENLKNQGPLRGNLNKGMIGTNAIEQIGGTQEYRTLKVSHTAPWGYQSFKVKIYFPLIGYAKINQAYDWYYIGAVSGVDYRGIYRASETATQDAVAIQRLQIGIKGASFIAKFDFRIRDGRYWTYYSS